MILRTFLLFLVVCFSALSPASADPAPFDLEGPALQVIVTRAGKSLPIGAVPNLAAGDALAIKADLPADQSAHYVLIAGFLRGATNPPPKQWFYSVKDWTPAGRDGLKVTVPSGAQQVIVLLAPESGGGFDTVVGAVRGRPGAFVRASQDLNQVSLDRSRLTAYLDSIRLRDPAHPDRLAVVSPLLARSLAIKLNVDCLQRVPSLQAACLTQNQDSLVLNDGHSTSIAEAFSGGPTADLALQISATPQGGFGYYSPYIAAIRDIVGILGSFHTAQYQYIPALGVARRDQLAFVLNAAPSFHNPKSVLTAALPGVQSAVPPPLQPIAAKDGFCGQDPALVLPVEGAPLIYSTGYARNMVFRLRARNGSTVDLPVKADAAKGGLVVDTSKFDASRFDASVDGYLHGDWGFDVFDGPHFTLENGADGSNGAWRVTASDQQSAIIGRDDTLKLEQGNAACVQGVVLRQPSGDTQPVAWKASGTGELTVTIPLVAGHPGPMMLLVTHYGSSTPTSVPVQAYKESSHIERFVLPAGDFSGVLSGTRLDEVASLEFGGVVLKPDGLTRSGGSDRLTLSAAAVPPGITWAAGDTKKGILHFVDGRTATLKVTIAPPGPRITLISKSVQPPPPTGQIGIRLAGDSSVPRDARLTFSVRAGAGTRFDGDESIEIATTDGTASTVLTSAQGLLRADAQVIVATLDVARAFSTSAFGPLRFRLIQHGVAGDWQALATLVRLPVLQALRCGSGDKLFCQLSGTNMFLISSTANNAAYRNPTIVPEGFTGTTLQVPRSADGRLYLKLHDDPETVVELIRDTSSVTETEAKR